MTSLEDLGHPPPSLPEDFPLKLHQQKIGPDKLSPGVCLGSHRQGSDFPELWPQHVLSIPPSNPLQVTAPSISGFGCVYFWKYELGFWEGGKNLPFPPCWATALENCLRLRVSPWNVLVTRLVSFFVW